VAAMLHAYLSRAICWRAAELAPALTASVSKHSRVFIGKTFSPQLLSEQTNLLENFDRYYGRLAFKR